MTNGLKKEDSAALKGLAVLLLIFHHCYRLADRIERYQVDLCGLTTEQLVAIAECCKICVAIFAFVSGYGLMYGYSAKMKNKKKYAVSEWISGHLLSTMSGFWFTAAVSYLIYFGLGLKDPSKWGETFYERGFAVFADILGISRLLETESLNGAWWYMSAAFVFIILLPLLDGTIEKFGGIFCIAVIFLLAAVPISAEVLSGAIFSALGGKVIHKLGAKRSVFVSSVLLTAGLGLRVVPNIWLLTLSALLLGAGWGVLLLLVNLMIVELPDEEKNRAYAYYSVSSLSGANCAVVFGGFLLQWMSYTALFAVTAVLSVLLFLVANKYMSKYTSDNEEENCETEDTHMNIVQFIFRPRIISFFLLMMIPLLICGYFLNYMFPIVGSEWGLSETYIGYTYLLNGIFVLILGTPLTEFFSNRGWKHFGLAVAAFIYAAAFLEVAMLQNIPSLLIALALIGVADSFGIPLLTSYFTDLKDVERFGYDRGLGVYSLFENGAQSLGSFVFGYVLVLGVGRGLIFVLILVSVLSAAFLISTTFAAHRDKKGGQRAWKKDES